MASFRSSAAQFSKISITPRVDHSAFDQGKCLGIAGSARHLDDSLTEQRFHALRNKLRVRVAVAETSVFAQAPRVQFAGGTFMNLRPRRRLFRQPSEPGRVFHRNERLLCG